MNPFSEFEKGIYETCHQNFFNLGLIVLVVFSIAQLKWFFFLLAMISKEL